jgi:hypothetical protein
LLKYVQIISDEPEYLALKKIRGFRPWKRLKTGESLLSEKINSRHFARPSTNDKSVLLGLEWCRTNPVATALGSVIEWLGLSRVKLPKYPRASDDSSGLVSVGL